MEKSKLRVAKDYDKLTLEQKEQIKLMYPDGFSQNLISYNDAKGVRVSALRFETEEAIFLVKMSVLEAEQIIEDDEDYDEDGILRSEIKEDYQDKYSDLETEEGEDDDFEE